MKTEIVFIPQLQKEITYYIGTNQSENFATIDLGEDNDIWFHSKNESSCHVVANICKDIPQPILKKNMRYILKQGALLCKQNTNKLKSQKNVEIIYTHIKNITKTDIPGRVITKDIKTVLC